MAPAALRWLLAEIQTFTTILQLIAVSQSSKILKESISKSHLAILKD